MKFCVDCKWFDLGKIKSFCKHPDIGVTVTSLVTGETHNHVGYCEQERMWGSSKCGPEGFLWEAKTPTQEG